MKQLIASQNAEVRHTERNPILYGGLKVTYEVHRMFSITTNMSISNAQITIIQKYAAIMGVFRVCGCNPPKLTRYCHKSLNKLKYDSMKTPAKPHSKGFFLASPD